jgi:hypothetical protein
MLQEVREEVTRKETRAEMHTVFTGLLVRNAVYELERITFTNKLAQDHNLYF